MHKIAKVIFSGILILAGVVVILGLLWNLGQPTYNYKTPDGETIIIKNFSCMKIDKIDSYQHGEVQTGKYGGISVTYATSKPFVFLIPYMSVPEPGVYVTGNGQLQNSMWERTVIVGPYDECPIYK